MVRFILDRRAVIALALPLALGCVVRTPVQIQTVFDYQEHAPYNMPGGSSLTGQGFLRQRGGGIVTCAGNAVYMMPATSFFREVINHLRAGNKPEIANKIDPGYKAIIKQSQCDSQGNFSFSKLPPGSWFVVTEVTWVVRYDRQGGGLMREVRLGSDETVKLLLTEKDFIGR